MKQVDEIIYDAILADDALKTLIGWQPATGSTPEVPPRVKSTCFEVPPTDDDNTPLPNIIITDDGFQNQTGTKDTIWESEEDRMQVSVDVAASSPNEVKALVKQVRRAIEAHIVSLYQQGEDTPELESLTSSGIAWDWMKPCYYQVITYTCITKADTEDEQEN